MSGVAPLRCCPRVFGTCRSLQVVEGSFEFGERLLHPLGRTLLGRHLDEVKENLLVVAT